MSVATDVEQFVVREMWSGEHGDSIAHDYDLLEAELIDSLGIAELVEFLEKKYGIAVDDDDLDAENFRNVDAIAALVESKRR